MLSKTDIDKIVGNYENTRELTDLIRTMQAEATILKACIANLIDDVHGSVYGIEGDQLEALAKQFAKRFQVTEAMATVMIEATQETSENCTFGII